jgi:hypothetical protein
MVEILSAARSESWGVSKGDAKRIVRTASIGETMKAEVKEIDSLIHWFIGSMKKSSIESMNQ